MPRVVHFEFNADDPERAVRFYSDVFGWEIQKWKGPADYWLASTGDGIGIDGALQGAPDFVEGQKAVVTMDVGSVDDTIAKVEAAGGSVVVPKMAIPHVGWLVYFRDTEGMVFGAMESDESARAEDTTAAATGETAAAASGDEAGGGETAAATSGDEAAGGETKPAGAGATTEESAAPAGAASGESSAAPDDEREASAAPASGDEGEASAAAADAQGPARG
jgi:uncharacterized protein